MPALTQLFENNRAWADQITRQDPGFFDRLARQQAPRYPTGCAPVAPAS